ncbi:hypothetical protein TNCV_5071581 [Trichonephila clavipes]|nr:hypothetical protein TNCV_5071581 [Trichonephila clavipes]
MLPLEDTGKNEWRMADFIVMMDVFAFLMKSASSPPKVVRIIKQFCVTFRGGVRPIKEFVAMAEKSAAPEY